MPKYVVLVEVNGKIKRKTVTASTPERAAEKAKKHYEAKQK